MEAVARIRFGLAEGEFWRITPRQFAAYSRECGEREKRHWQPFRFLATVVARCAGNEDADYMEEAEPELGQADPAVFEAWLRAHAAPVEAVGDGERVQANSGQNEGANGVTEGV